MAELHSIFQSIDTTLNTNCNADLLDGGHAADFASGANLSNLSGAFWTLSGANANEHTRYLYLSGANINQNIIPPSDKIFDLGSASKRFGICYCNGINSSGNLYTDYIASDFTPNVTNTYSLGNDNLGWKNIFWTQRLSGGNIQAGTISGAFLFVSGATIKGENDAGGIILTLHNASSNGSTTTPYVEINGFLSSIRKGSAIRFGRDNIYAGAPYADSHIKFYTTLGDVNIERMRINSAGNVSIGTGGDPSVMLDISGSTGISINRTSASYGASFIYKKNNVISWTIKEDANGQNNNSLVYSNATEDGTGIGQVMTFTQTGNIGIGTGNTLPTQKLEVSGGNIICSGQISGATIKAKNGFTGTGAYTNFTISGGIILAAS